LAKIDFSVISQQEIHFLFTDKKINQITKNYRRGMQQQPQEANSEDAVSPLSISLVHGQVDRTYSVGTGAWSATSRKITSHSQADAFKVRPPHIFIFYFKY
jgi:hypothetical protein